MLRNVTRSLGITLRAFQKRTNTIFETRELPREVASRVRRETKKRSQKQGKRQTASGTTSHSIGARNKGKGVIQEAATSERDVGKGYLIGYVTLFVISLEITPEPSALHSEPPYTRRPKVLNLNTYKLHSLGDYPDTIKQYGTTDSYSTQLVSKCLSRTNNKELNFFRVSRRIAAQRLPFCARTRRSTRNSLLRSKGGTREFAAFDRSFQIDRRLMKPWYLSMTGMKLDIPRSFQSIFLTSWAKTSVILLLRQGLYAMLQLFPFNIFLHRTSCHDSGPTFYRVFWTFYNRKPTPNPIHRQILSMHQHLTFSSVMIECICTKSSNSTSQHTIWDATRTS